MSGGSAGLACMGAGIVGAASDVHDANLNAQFLNHCRSAGDSICNQDEITKALERYSDAWNGLGLEIGLSGFGAGLSGAQKLLTARRINRAMEKGIQELKVFDDLEQLTQRTNEIESAAQKLAIQNTPEELELAVQRLENLSTIDEASHRIKAAPKVVKSTSQIKREEKIAREAAAEEARRLKAETFRSSTTSAPKKTEEPLTHSTTSRKSTQIEISRELEEATQLSDLQPGVQYVAKNTTNPLNPAIFEITEKVFKELKRTSKLDLEKILHAVKVGVANRAEGVSGIKKLIHIDNGYEIKTMTDIRIIGCLKNGIIVFQAVTDHAGLKRFSQSYCD